MSGLKMQEWLKMDTLKGITPPREHGTRWIQEEVALLKKAINQNCIELQILELFPRRTAEAITNKANSLGYGRKTDQNGNVTFHEGINHIKRRTKAELEGVNISTTNKIANDAVETIAAESTDIIADTEQVSTSYTKADAKLDIEIATAEATVIALRKLKDNPWN